jgi:SAM-dependent methyltransferase
MTDPSNEAIASAYQRLNKGEFPRSSGYDPAWILDNQMGPNALWLLEWLCEELPLETGMRVLDLGCGRAMTSIYLARELGVQVWAADLWIGPDHNWRRASEAGVADQVCPMRLEAHALPFAQGFFDAIVSIDAYTYFGTDDLYLGYLAGFLRPGGLLGVVVPGLSKPIDAEVPEHLTTPQQNGAAFWEDECTCFHTAAWWRNHWGRCAKVDQVATATMPDGWRHWRDFERSLEETGKGRFPPCHEALDRDQGEYIAFVRATARRREGAVENLYDPSLGVRFGVDQ